MKQTTGKTPIFAVITASATLFFMVACDHTLQPEEANKKYAFSSVSATIPDIFDEEYFTEGCKSAADGSTILLKNNGSYILTVGGISIAGTYAQTEGKIWFETKNVQSVLKVCGATTYENLVVTGTQTENALAFTATAKIIDGECTTNATINFLYSIFQTAGE